METPEAIGYFRGERSTMRTSYLLFIPLFSFLSTAAFAADGEKPVSSTITAAKVFLNGAQVERSAKATVAAGSGTLVFTGLAERLDPQSIQVTGKGAYSILSVAHRINYLSESPNKKEVDDLQARIKAKEHDTNAENNAKVVWDLEEQLLLKNTAIAGQQNGVSASQLQAVNDYVRERLKTIKAGQLAQAEKLVQMNEDLTKLRQQLQQLKGQAARPTSEVVLEVEAAASAAATFTISYFVSNASWTPAYDLRATGTGKPIELTMKAQVVNGTGEDWDKVALSLSSGNPTLGGIMPQIHPWTLSQPYRTQGLLNRVDHAEMQAVPSMAKSKDDAGATLDAIRQVPNTVLQRTTTMEFSIDAPFSIPADGVAHSVSVTEHTIPATYKHYCTPKLDRDAFLYARTTGWEDMNLLPGVANVFFEGTYVGKSYLDLDQPHDTLDISLGRDKGITVERVKRKTTNEKAVIGSKRTVSVGWDITVRNTKSVAVDLELRDQYPLSPRSEVEVKLEDKGGADVNEQTGMLTWKITVAPKETKKMGFGYTVKYPKDMPVVVE
jgi:uncharacterized protein (TIGR02231 family)